MTEKNGNPREVKLSDGRRLSISLSGCTWKDVMTASRSPRTAPEYAAFMAKAVGLGAEEFEALPYVEARGIEERVWAFVQNPVDADPN